jgi:hypothetical protein
MLGLNINVRILEVKPRVKIIGHDSLMDFRERQALKIKSNQSREMSVPIILGLFCCGHDCRDGLGLAALILARRVGRREITGQQRVCKVVTTGRSESKA